MPDWLGVSAFGLAAAAMVATPLSPRRQRTGLASVVVVGLAATTLARSARRWGWRRALVTFATVGPATLAVEHVGSATGVPFGRYRYTGVLRPRWGGVPLVVPLAWYALAVPARETALAILAERASPLRRAALGAMCLSAWDAFLDPQMVGEGYWCWERPGRYRGIPASNFAGWMVASLGLMTMLDRLLPPRRAADPGLVGLYGYVAVMSALGFALFFGDPIVALVGGAAMLGPAAVAARRLLPSRTAVEAPLTGVRADG